MENNNFDLMDCDNNENKENQENLDGLSPVKFADDNVNLDPSEAELRQLILKPYQCETCGYKTVIIDCLKEHVIKTHTEVDLYYTCKYCDFKTNNKKTLTDHAQVHLIEKPFACKICNSSFTSKPCLQTHTRIHFGGKPFACHVCHYRTSSNTALKRHLKVNHDEPYGCGICDASFADKTSLKDHFWKIHSILS